MREYTWKGYSDDELRRVEAHWERRWSNTPGLNEADRMLASVRAEMSRRETTREWRAQVEARKVTADNGAELAKWCGGDWQVASDGRVRVTVPDIADYLVAEGEWIVRVALTPGAFAWTALGRDWDGVTA